MKFLFSLAVVFIVCPAAITKWLEWRHSIGWSVELSAMFNNFWNEKKNKTTIGMYAFKLPTNKHPKQCIKIHFINCLLIIRMLFNSFKFYIGKLSFIYVVSKKSSSVIFDTRCWVGQNDIIETRWLVLIMYLLLLFRFSEALVLRCYFWGVLKNFYRTELSSSIKAMNIITFCVIHAHGASLKGDMILPEN